MIIVHHTAAGVESTLSTFMAAAQTSANYVIDRDGQIITRRELGLVSQVFSENDLRTLAGELAIGHVRYSTTGANA